MTIRWWCWFLAWGCAGKQALPVGALGCPPGTSPEGAAPPLGTEVWCERTLSSGLAVREGPSTRFWPDGAIAAQGGYRADRPDGLWRTFWPTGATASEGSWAVGEREGPWQTWAEDGRLTSRGSYADDREQGVWELFDGDAVTTGAYANGLRQGTWVESGPGGPIRERTYQDGRLIGVRER